MARALRGPGLWDKCRGTPGRTAQMCTSGHTASTPAISWSNGAWPFFPLMSDLTSPRCNAELIGRTTAGAAVLSQGVCSGDFELLADAGQKGQLLAWVKGTLSPTSWESLGLQGRVWGWGGVSSGEGRLRCLSGKTGSGKSHSRPKPRHALPQTFSDHPNSTRVHIC